MDYVVAVEGLEAIDFDNAPAKIRRYASMAVNRALRRARADAKKQMLAEVNFGARYLGNVSDGALRIAAFSTPATMEGRVRGRDRPTSLARFTRQQPLARGARRRRTGVTVSVKPGSSNTLERAFLVRLNQGRSIGLAVRTQGGPPAAAYKPSRLANGVWLLYGPSVDQVFRGVAQDVEPDAIKVFRDEFLRLVQVDL